MLSVRQKPFSHVQKLPALGGQGDPGGRADKNRDPQLLLQCADHFADAGLGNANQVQAMVDNVEEQMYKAGFDDPKVEGYNNASWILLDYNDVVLHIFDEESRSFYNLERLWRDGKEVDVDTL